MLCQDCKKRNECVELCEEAEKYASQDHVSQAHLIPNEAISHIQALPNITKSKKELILLMYFTDRLTQVQVAEKLYVSQPYVSKIISAAKKKLGI